MKKLILLCIIYTPIFLVTLFVIGLSGIDYSCRFTDLHCILTHRENLIDYLIIYAVNLIFLVPIIKKIMVISKEEEQKQQNK